MNTSEHVSKFIQEARRRGYGENTIKNYVSNLNCFLEGSMTKMFAWLALILVIYLVITNI